MARRTKHKRTRNERIWILVGLLVATSMILAMFLPALVQ